MEKINLNNLKTTKIFEVEKDKNYHFYPHLIEDDFLKKHCIFNFSSSNTSAKIIYKCVLKKNSELDLTITLSTKKEKIQNVEAFLEVYILNLDDNNSISIKPFLEIPQQGLKFEHKVTIGAPNKKWVDYLSSRGIGYKKALELISKSFITG